MIKDMTVGKPISLIIKFAIPLLLGNLFQQLYNISDILILGRILGVNALAAAGASAPIFYTMLLVTFGFTAGLCVITAQRFGAKDEIGVRRSVTHSIVASAVLCTIVTFILCFYMHDILRAMNIPEKIMKDAHRFIFTLTLGLILIVGYNLLAGFIRALGDSKTPLYFLIFSSILNILLNLFFIYVLKLGIIGSALGTIVAMAISVVCCMIYIGKRFPILKLRKEDWKLNWDFMKSHLAVAVPMSLQFSVIAVGLLIIQAVCNSFGENTIAAFTSALRIEQLATQPIVAIGLALATYAAQNYGAGQIKRIRQGVAGTSVISIIFSICIALLVRFYGENFIDIFLKEDNPEIIKIGHDYLNISTMFYIFLGQIFIFRNTLQGMGRTIIPLIASIAELVMRSFAAVYLATRIGYLGLCYASPIAWIGASLVVAVGYAYTLRQIRNQRIYHKMKQLGHKLGLCRHQQHMIQRITPDNIK